MSRYIKLAKELTFSPSVMTNGKKAVDLAAEQIAMGAAGNIKYIYSIKN